MAANNKGSNLSKTKGFSWFFIYINWFVINCQIAKQEVSPISLLSLTGALVGQRLFLCPPSLLLIVPELSSLVESWGLEFLQRWPWTLGPNSRPPSGTFFALSWTLHVIKQPVSILNPRFELSWLAQTGLTTCPWSCSASVLFLEMILVSQLPRPSLSPQGVPRFWWAPFCSVPGQDPVFSWRSGVASSSSPASVYC